LPSSTGGNVQYVASTPKQEYEIRLNGRIVASRADIDAQFAVLDYLRSIGCEPDEVIRVGNDSASWRGAVYTAAAVSEEDEPA
jgi:hypothetical protein